MSFFFYRQYTTIFPSTDTTLSSSSNDSCRPSSCALTRTRITLGALLLSILLLLLLFLYYVDIQEGFSFRVGLGTKCTQYLFRDHFFLTNLPTRYASIDLLSMLLSMLLALLFYLRRDSVIACYLVYRLVFVSYFATSFIEL